MVDKHTWIRQAYLRYHAGEITREELHAARTGHTGHIEVSRETEKPVVDRESRLHVVSDQDDPADS